MKIIDYSFYQEDTVIVAKKLLGARLIRIINEKMVSGVIIETEAYCGSNDSASHAYKKTKRSEIMYGKVGRAYIYFTYGMHFCFNVVAKDINAQAGAVLIRAVEPVDGIKLMEQHRKKDGLQLTNGPAKLAQALQISKKLSGTDITQESELFIVYDRTVNQSEIICSPRIGISTAKDKKWRFYIKNNKWVSKK